MKLISWNINGIRSINGQNPKRRYDKVFHENTLFDYIERENPDIICLQETKAEPSQIKDELREPPGYIGYFSSSKLKKGYSGTVTYTKKEPISVKTDLNIEKFDNEGRIVELDFGDFVHFNVYFPNGTSGRERVDFKLEFYDELFKYAEELRKSGKELIISGDYNTAHKPIDLARPEANEDTSGFLPEEREKLDQIVENGFIDTFRMFTSEGDHYTWWSQRGRARERNVGWRIDYHFVTSGLEKQVKSSIHQPEQKGSDHCPIIIELDI